MCNFRVLAALAFAFACPIFAQTVAIVGTPAENNTTSSVTSIAATVTIGTGNAVIAAVNWGNTSDTAAVTDTGSANTFTPFTKYTRPDGNASIEFFCAKNSVAVAGDVIAAAFTGGSVGYVAIDVFQVSGADLSAPCANIAFGSGSSGATLTSAAFSTSVNSSLAILFGNVSGSVTWTVGSGYTFGPHADTYTGSEYRIFTTTQSGITGVLTQSGSAAWVISGVVVKAAVAGASPCAINDLWAGRC